MKLIKKGLFGEVNCSAASIYKSKKISEDAYNIIINNHTNNSLIKQLIFKFIDNISYSISARFLKEQLNLISSLTIDDQIKILNKTLQNGWKSFNPAYKELMKHQLRCANATTVFISKNKIKKDDIVKENF